VDLMLANQYFVRVVETESFSACAREFGVMPSSVTRAVSTLEDSVGVSLLHRTTRRVLPTEAGRSYFNRIRQALIEMQEAKAEAAGLGTLVQGTLRVSAPIGLGQLRILPMIPRFLAKHPKVRFEVQLSDEYVDLLQARIDVAVRVGSERESSLTQRKLQRYRRILCASPQYLKIRGLPAGPGDLAKHDCLTFNYGPESKIWYFKESRGAKPYSVDGSLHVNSVEAILECARQGLGLCLLPSWTVARDLEQGALVEVMKSERANLSPTFDESLVAVFIGKKPAPKIRAWVEFLVEEFAQR
jgi:DNA-binding transcriptional LysR family regulator